MALPNMKNVYEDTVANIADNLRHYATEQLPKLLALVSKDAKGQHNLKCVEDFIQNAYNIAPVAPVVAVSKNEPATSVAAATSDAANGFNR